MLVPRYEPYQAPRPRRDIGTAALRIALLGAAAYAVLTILHVGWRGLVIFVDLLDNLPF
jgi:hypothetical protein